MQEPLPALLVEIGVYRVPDLGLGSADLEAEGPRLQEGVPDPEARGSDLGAEAQISRRMGFESRDAPPATRDGRPRS